MRLHCGHLPRIIARPRCLDRGEVHSKPIESKLWKKKKSIPEITAHFSGASGY